MVKRRSIFVFSYKHHVGIDGFHYTLSDIIHSLHPRHLVGGFELFGHAFLFGVFFYQREKRSCACSFISERHNKSLSEVINL